MYLFEYNSVFPHAFRSNIDYLNSGDTPKESYAVRTGAAEVTIRDVAGAVSFALATSDEAIAKCMQCAVGGAPSPRQGMTNGRQRSVGADGYPAIASLQIAGSIFRPDGSGSSS